MDTDGTITLPLQYDFIYCSGNQLFAIKDGVMQHVDKYGKVLKSFCSEYDLKPLYLPHDYDEEHPTGYFKYYVYGRKGVVDSRGRVVIPAIYEEINQLDTFLFEAKFNSYEGPWRLIEVTK